MLVISTIMRVVETYETGILNRRQAREARENVELDFCGHGFLIHPPR